jgi:Rhodanese-like domain
MRTMVAALAISVFTAGFAQAQYKPTPQPAPAVNPGGSPVQIIPSGQGQPKLQPQPDQSLESAKRISREDAQKMVKEGKAVYVDVRSKEQYDIAHIPGAINIPLGELPNRWRDLPLGKYLITYCA